MIIVNREGLLVDTSSGVVVDESPIDYSFDGNYRWYDAEQRLAREHHAALRPRFHDYAVGSVMDCRDATGARVDPELVRLLRRLDAETRKRERNVVQAFKMLNELVRLLGLSREEARDAAAILRRLLRLLGHGPKSCGLAVKCSLLLAARGTRPVRELEEALGISGRECARLAWDAHSSLPVSWRRKTQLLLEKLLDWLGATPQTRMLAYKLLSSWYDMLLGASPQVVAATVAYVACKLLERATQTAIAREAGIHEASIRHALRKIGLHIIYIIDGNGKRVVVDEWWPGKDSYGIRSPEELASTMAYKLRSVHVELEGPKKIVVTMEVE